jgi:pheromone shutdown-related protein TraB
LERLIGDNIILIGTAHVSEKSVAEVREAIRRHRPDIVAVELDPSRYKVLTGKRNWKDLPITRLLQGNNPYFFIAQAFLSAIQRRLGMEQGVQPGAEMLAAVHEAAEHDLKVVLADRDIGITLKRAWKRMTLREKLRIFWNLLAAITGLYDEEELEELDIEKLMEEDMISMLLDQLSEMVPSVANVLIHERDTFIAKKIRQASKDGKVLAVVGAGHVKGLAKKLEEGKPLPTYDDLNYVPIKRVSIARIVAYGVPWVFLWWLLYMAITGQYEALSQGFLIWFLINGTFAAAGAALALGHPYSIATAFGVAWFTSLNPTIAAGWFAGLVEAKVRKPTMADLEYIDAESMRGFLGNKVVRVLMVTALANVGSVIATVYALPYIIGTVS